MGELFMILFIVIICFHNFVCASNQTSLADIQKMAAQLSAEGHPVTLSMQVLENTNVQTNTLIFTDITREFVQKSKQQLTTGFQLLWDMIKNNKKKISMYSFIMLCGAVQARLWYIKYQLNKKSCWSQFKKDKKIEELYEVPVQDFSRILLSDIQRTYTQLDNPTNFVGPIKKFIKDSETELHMLEEYKNFVDLADKLWLKNFLFYDKNLLAQIPERINRIKYLQSSFINWLTEFKVQNPGNFLHSN
jgi:hypothetical protein